MPVKTIFNSVRGESLIIFRACFRRSAAGDVYAVVSQFNLDIIERQGGLVRLLSKLILDEYFVFYNYSIFSDFCADRLTVCE